MDGVKGERVGRELDPFRTNFDNANSYGLCMQKIHQIN